MVHASMGHKKGGHLASDDSLDEEAQHAELCKAAILELLHL